MVCFQTQWMGGAIVNQDSSACGPRWHSVVAVTLTSDRMRESTVSKGGIGRLSFDARATPSCTLSGKSRLSRC